MKKLLLLLLLSLSLIGCSDDVEKEQIEKKKFQIIEVEGVCFENHTTVQDDYEGSIDLYVELPTNIVFAVGFVMQKEPFHHLSDLLESEYDEDELFKTLHTYTPPLAFYFDEWNSQDQDTILKSRLKLNGLSNPQDPDGGAQTENQYLSTCLLDVLKREEVNK